MRAAKRPPGTVGLEVVDELAEPTMRSGRRIGLVVGCLCRGEQRLVGYGRVGNDAQDLPDGGTLFEIGSVTKVFTGLLLADLAEKGIVSLDDPLAGYLPEPYETLVRQRICLPLGMGDTVLVPTAEQTARLATGHTRRGRPAPPLEIPALVGAGGLRSTATDLLRFLQANLDPAHTPLAGRLERAQQPRLRAAKRLEVGLGWLIASPPGSGGPVLWHNGGTGGFRSFVAVVRQTGTAVVVLSNTARSVDRLGLRLLRVLPGSAG